MGIFPACLTLVIGSAGLPVVSLLYRTGSIQLADLFLIVLGGRVTAARAALWGRLAASRAGTACAITGLRVVCMIGGLLALMRHRLLQLWRNA
jgi:hypothetical protein